MKRHFWRFFAWSLIALCLFTCAFADGFSSDPDAIEKAALSVLKLEIYDTNGDMIGTGSGFVMFDNMTLVTNYHVIDGGTDVYAISDEGYRYQLNRVIVCSSYQDLAILRFSTPTVMQPLPYAKTTPKRAEPVVAIGSPKGFKNTISTGIVSGYDKIGDIDYIMFTAAISPGSSGGALFNNSGEVIGITSSFWADAQNLNNAIDIREALDLYAAWDGKTTYAIKNYTLADVGNPTSSALFDILEIETSLGKRTDDRWTDTASCGDGAKVSLSELTGSEYYTPYLTLTNTGFQQMGFSVSAVLDGEIINWENYEIDAKDYLTFYLSRGSAPQKGSHTMVWSVNGTEVATFTWTVSDDDWLNSADIRTTLDKRTLRKYVGTVTKQSGDTVYLSELDVGQYYSPYLIITNNSSKTVSGVVTAVLDGNSLSWNEYTFYPGKPVSICVREKLGLGEGSHTIVWSVNGVEIGSFSWKVLDKNWLTTADFSAELWVFTKQEKYEKTATEQSGATVNLSRLEKGRYYSPILYITNNSSETVNVVVTAVLDGKNINWNDQIFEAEESFYYYLTKESAPGKGSHTIVWSVDGKEVATFKWIVSDNDWLKSADVRTTLDKRTLRKYVGTVTKKSGATVYLSELDAGQYYSPYLVITNKSNEKVTAVVTAVLDGKDLSWNENTFYVGKPLSICVKEKLGLGKGSHTIVWSIDGIEVATFKWTVK